MDLFILSKYSPTFPISLGYRDVPHFLLDPLPFPHPTRDFKSG